MHVHTQPPLEFGSLSFFALPGHAIIERVIISDFFGNIRNIHIQAVMPMTPSWMQRKSVERK